MIKWYVIIDTYKNIPLFFIYIISCQKIHFYILIYLHHINFNYKKLQICNLKKVKITILKTTFQEDLAKEYGVDALSTCPLMKEGEVYYADYAKPEGFCDEAWKAIYQYVFALTHGASEIWYYEDWIKTPGVAIVSCNDGLRPVIMKLEATDIESNSEN